MTFLEQPHRLAKGATPSSTLAGRSINQSIKPGLKTVRASLGEQSGPPNPRHRLNPPINSHLVLSPYHTPKTFPRRSSDPRPQPSRRRGRQIPQSRTRQTPGTNHNTGLESAEYDGRTKRRIIAREIPRAQPVCPSIRQRWSARPNSRNGLPFLVQISPFIIQRPSLQLRDQESPSHTLVTCIGFALLVRTTDTYKRAALPPIFLRSTNPFHTTLGF